MLLKPPQVGLAHMVECLSSKYEAQSSNPSTTKKTKLLKVIPVSTQDWEPLIWTLLLVTKE
jgi:hypothetical protein